MRGNDSAARREPRRRSKIVDWTTDARLERVSLSSPGWLGCTRLPQPCCRSRRATIGSEHRWRRQLLPQTWPTE